VRERRSRVTYKERYDWRKANRLCTACEVALTSDNPYVKCPDCRKVYTNKLQSLKTAVLKYYGNSCCFCCGETNPFFLSIDHINNDGAHERRKLKSNRSGVNFYRWLVMKNFPSGYQVACHNCNLGRHMNGGVCPHACA
jgi:hypothetical protein